MQLVGELDGNTWRDTVDSRLSGWSARIPTKQMTCTYVRDYHPREDNDNANCFFLCRRLTVLCNADMLLNNSGEPFTADPFASASPSH